MMTSKTKTVCVVGLGYIGLPTAALIAKCGYKVFGIDTNPLAVETINRGEIHIVEPELDIFVKSAVNSNLLKAYSTPQSADIYMICVPTPFKNEKGDPKPNLDYVVAATQSIAPLIKKGDMVILESTSPVGTTEIVSKVLESENIDTDSLYIAYCPERVLPGKIMVELIDNDRVIGGLNHKSTKAVSEFYKTFVRGKILETSAKIAEMCKLTENSFRDVNIAFANELSKICNTHDIDVWDLIRLANHHPRVDVLSPSTGVGGHCIAVDPWFIVSGDPNNSQLIQTARNVNDTKPDWVVSSILREVELNKLGRDQNYQPKVACLGLAFKPDIDDLRGSPALKVFNALREMNVNAVAVEPNIEGNPNFELESLMDALEDSDVVAILVRHKEFLTNDVKNLLRDFNTKDYCGALV
jgi:UDP-N-acetyl-D-mannosaminuronic acid dehydrogenase